MSLNNNKRFYYNFITIVLAIVFSLHFSYSACADLPTNISFYSGSKFIGESPRVELSLIPIEIRGELDRNPLKIQMEFLDTDDNCFNSVDDIEFKLFSGGLFVPANSISNPSNSTTIVEFVFSYSTKAPGSFTSSYNVITSGSSGTIKFLVDDTAPYFEQLKIEPLSAVLPMNASVNVEYKVVDTGSGLKSVKISGYEDYDLEGNSSFSGKIQETLQSSKKYTITVEDILGNSYEEELEFIVDNSKPVFSNLNILNYIKDAQGRYISFSIDVVDSSYSKVDSSPVVYGDFDSLSSDFSNFPGSCSKDVLNENKYVCVFNRINIDKLDETSTVPLIFKTTDSANNQAEQTFSQSIFYDNDGPKINEFYLVNSMGKKNVFNAFDNDVMIYLEFSDESLKDSISFNEFRVISDFDDSFFDNDIDREFINGKGYYKWNISDYIKKYSGVTQGSVIFKINVYDSYGNPSYQSINVTINNNVPQITSIEFIENDYSDDSIKDGLITSKEIVNFRIIIQDDDILDYTSNFIFASLSSIADYDEYIAPNNCVRYEQTSIQCDFTQIKVRNGYLLKNITFVATDIAGNRDVENYEVEIFAVGDEVSESFKIEDIEITNLLNRNLISTSGSRAWFEGLIENIHTEDEIFVVNYMLKSCNDSQLDPILIGERNLYPEDVVKTIEDNEEAIRDFAIKMEVRTHPNYNDLNNKTMKCTMAIRKRDATTVYPDEPVDFNVNFLFYDLPYDNLLKANAQSILEDARAADFLGSWFGSLYDIYDILAKTCTVVNTADATISSLSQAWTYISWAMNGIPPAQPAKQAGDKATYGIQGTISNLLFSEDSPLTKMCNFVTCANGGLLGDFWDSSGFEESTTGQLLNGEFLDEWSNSICIADDEGANK
ncbi:MAG: hypothetical protein PF569_04600 [Candidatus Woesearchaeota archaeon]|jgi:hypothetical protein|nr:hypothetical protein [Candidatus Woesearchaeota archaeon]